VEVSELRSSHTPEWDAFVRDRGDGSPFHLTAWKRVVEQAYGHRAHYLVARRGGGIEGVLPLFEMRTLLGRHVLVSVPYGVYGGVCAASPDAARALVDAATHLARARGAAHVELRHRGDPGLGLPTKALYVTFSRPLGVTDEENALAIPRKQRRMTRQGARHGLVTRWGRDHFDAFYDVYAESLRNLGSPVFPRRLLWAVLDAFEKEAELLTVWQGSTLLGGVLTLFYEDQVLPYYGAARRDARQYGVNDFMYWELMCHATRAGFRTFDFGRSRVGTGAYDFKRHWGFEPVPLPYQYLLVGTDRLPNVNPSNPRWRIAVRTWQRLPLPVANRIGPVLTRFLPG
jgi:FemAB-related protein (PEP-CTERM system-associated)